MSHEAEEIMNDIKKQVEVNKTDQDRSNDEFRQKKEAVQRARVNKEYDRNIESENMIKSFDNLSLDMTSDIVGKAIENNTEYFKLAAEKRLFLNQQVFHGVIPFHSKNLILLGATSGSGKTTIAANLAFWDLQQGGDVMIITNEETMEDFLNRETCLLMGWHYNNHGDFSKEKVDVLNKYIEILSKKLTVINDTHGGQPYGVTTTLEGIMSILNNAMKRYQETGKYYSSIIIDYYQGITMSLRDPSLVNWQVQEKLALFLDSFKNVYPGPIVVLSQLKPGDEDFKTRIEGRKMIFNKCTTAAEVIADKSKRATQFKLHKGRYAQYIGEAINVGYENGKYVKYDSAFIDKVEMSRIRQHQKEDIAEDMKKLSGGNDETND